MQIKFKQSKEDSDVFNFGNENTLNGCLGCFRQKGKILYWSYELYDVNEECIFDATEFKTRQKAEEHLKIHISNWYKNTYNEYKEKIKLIQDNAKFFGINLK